MICCNNMCLQPRGELLTSLSFNSKTSVLQGILLKLTNIISTSDRGNSPGTYVYIYGIQSQRYSSYIIAKIMIIWSVIALLLCISCVMILQMFVIQWNLRIRGALGQ